MARIATAARRTPDDKRTVILDAALLLFGRYGYRRTSIDDIAREAGIAKGTVYLYFETKEAIFRALSRRVLDGVLAQARRAAALRGTLEARLGAILGAKFGFFHDLLHGSPHASELIDSTSQLGADILAKADAAYAQLLTKAIADAIRRGEVTPRRIGLTPDAIADLLMAGAHGVEHSAKPPLTSEAHRAKLATLVRVVVAALAVR